MTRESHVRIQTLRDQETTSLQVDTSKLDNIINILHELTWYHNGSKIVSDNDPRLNLTNNNKTLTITNFSSDYAGVYKVQFDQIRISPSNEHCKNEILSLMRHYPILKPAVFCINEDSNCSYSIIKNQPQRISLRSVDSKLSGTFNDIALEADATVLKSWELEHFFIDWYRNGIRISSSSYLSSLQRNYNSWSLSQKFHQFNTSYEHSGRYEVQLKVNMYTYFQAGSSRSSCQTYYDNFLQAYFGYRPVVSIATDFVDIHYHKGIGSYRLSILFLCTFLHFRFNT